VRGAGLERGFGSGVDAVGSSTPTRWGCVHNVKKSPLARVTAIGTGGSSIRFRSAGKMLCL
jgi:hypothetical protein